VRGQVDDGVVAGDGGRESRRVEQIDHDRVGPGRSQAGRRRRPAGDSRHGVPGADQLGDGGCAQDARGPGNEDLHGGLLPFVLSTSAGVRV
jgi:hypothetical protein